MIDSDEETDSDEEDIKSIFVAKKLLNRDDDGKKKDHIDIEERDSSGSDTDDPDKDKIDSVVFMPKKEGISETTSSSSKKRPADLDTNGGEAKKAKVEPSIPEGLNEETVRKYLRRKPHTTKELLTKIMQKCSDMTKAEVVTKLAAILKAIEPHQFKQKQGKKEVLFFSLTNSLVVSVDL
uniref:Transcription initiation factor IIF subunit alpha n=1 Tax=Heterorhabditis bacteriophora TaxID=37862 RepID=A0A1I7WRN7_HETBA